MNADELKTEGLRLFQAGAYDEAVTTFETAVTAYKTAGDMAGQGEMLNNIGVIRRLQGKREPAQTALTEAAALFVQVGDRNRQAQALGNLGDLYAAKDRTEAARYYSDAAQLFAEDGDREKQSQVLRALSLMRLRQGRFVEAMQRMEESLAARPRLGVFPRIFRSLLRFALKLFGVR
ncbi:MAG: tetratricopeptide repeat protein [Ardenticatenaceae bacterium]|nr:tetratricopeptide repeat protein [Ardenticatenaceae bacterium]